ncbi:hypothetical protein PAMA_000642 [Pampus argenteus]
MMKMKQTLCRIFCLVTLVLELSWINVGHSMHREEGSRVMELWESEVRSASSLDELLRLADFPDWKLWKCRMRLQQPESQTETLFSPPPAGSHRSTRYAAESYSLEILKAIDEEWQRTQCMPRETCVDVAKELGTDPSMFFKPPCVSIHSSWMPDCEIDVERCDCLPRPEPTIQLRPIHRCHLNSSICAHRHQRFDRVSCR